MIRLLLLSFFLCDVYSKDLWDNPPIRLSNITFEKNTPINVPQQENLEIINLNGTLYSNSLSQIKAKDVRLSFDHLEKIETGAICSSPTLQIFEIVLGPNNGFRVTKDVLKNCENLKELSIIGDDEKLHQVDIDAFENLSRLKNLILVQLDLPQVKKEFFKNLEALEYLTLRRCSVKEIDSDAFEDLTNLKELEIYFNHKLTRIPENVFKNNAKLKRLLLVGNNITSFTWDEFKGLSSLEELNIGRNSVTSYNAEKIAQNLPSLEEFNFELNPMECNEREAFANELRKKMKHPINISHKYDPGYYDSCEDGREI